MSLFRGTNNIFVDYSSPGEILGFIWVQRLCVREREKEREREADFIGSW